MRSFCILLLSCLIFFSTTHCDGPCSTPYSTIVNGTCCANYCSGQDSSEDCSTCGGLGNSKCVRIPNEYCRAGYWPEADLLTGKWLPSRSTHYGYTTAGACGFGPSPNCYPGGNIFPEDCANIPDDLKTSPMAGMYAAPQGDYYDQLNNYLSCGECFEVKCVDKYCSTTESIVLQIVDSCPCGPNTKWCCGPASHCGELTPATDGPAHCAITGGQWDPKSIHLDLSNPAFGQLTTGDKTKFGGAGIVNTLFRRVLCPVKGNIYVRFSSGVAVFNCSTVWPNPARPCFYYLEFGVLNAAGLGGIAEVQIFAGIVEGGKLVDKWFTLPHDPNYSSTRVQERFGGYANPPGINIYLPISFAFISRSGERVVSLAFSTIQNCKTEYCYLDTGVQFKQ